MTYDLYDHALESDILPQHFITKYQCNQEYGMKTIAKRVRSYSISDLNCAKKSPLSMKMAKRGKDYPNYNTRDTAVANVKPKIEKVIHT
jgi:hypothetical protein